MVFLLLDSKGRCWSMQHLVPSLTTVTYERKEVVCTVWLTLEENRLALIDISC